MIIALVHQMAANRRTRSDLLARDRFFAALHSSQKITDVLFAYVEFDRRIF